MIIPLPDYRGCLSDEHVTALEAMKSCENFPEASEGQDTGPEACAETEETIPSNGEKVKGSRDIT